NAAVIRRTHQPLGVAWSAILIDGDIALRNFGAIETRSGDSITDFAGREARSAGVKKMGGFGVLDGANRDRYFCHGRLKRLRQVAAKTEGSRVRVNLSAYLFEDESRLAGFHRKG